jgi:hypothetical protein
VDGAPAIYVEPSGRALRLFDRVEGAALELAARALGEVARHRPGQQLRIETVDGHPARSSPEAALLLGSGFAADYRGLVLDGRARGAAGPGSPH